MIPRKIFTYWDGTKHPYIKHCLDTFKRSNVEFVILNSENIDGYINQTDLHPNWKRLEEIIQKVDCLRIGLLQYHGGVWVDADTIIIKDCNSLFDAQVDCRVCQWDLDGVLSNGYIISQPKSGFMTKVLGRINDKLENNFRPVYQEHSAVDLGETIFEAVRKNFQPTIMPRHLFLPIEFRGHPRIWKSNESIETYLRPDTVGIGLNNSQHSVNIKNMSIDEICRQGGLFGNVFRHSLKLGNL